MIAPIEQDTPANDQIGEFISDIAPIFRGRQVFIADVGAHVGATFAAFFRSGLQVNRACLFEANPKNFAELERSVRELSAEKRATCLQVAVSDKPGMVKLHDMNDMSRVLGPDAEVTGDGKVFDVEARPLDDFRELFPDGHISILKVDVEGHELEVFRGAAGLLSDGAVDVIYVEAGFDGNNVQQTHYREIEDLLSEHGYSRFKIYEQTLEWVEDRPVLRRMNMAFVSPAVATKYPYSLLKELTRQDAQIEELNARLGAQADKFKQSHMDLAILSRDVNELENEKVALSGKVDELKPALEKVRADLKAERPKLAKKEAELKTVLANLAKSEEKLKKAVGELEKKEETIKTLRRQREEKDTALRASRLKGSRMEEKLAILRAELTEKTARLKTVLPKLEKTAAERKSTLEALAQEQGKRTELERRVRDLETSTSWKLTAPLRSVADRVKGR